MKRKYPGYFITLEGGEGCGKTCHIPRLVEMLQQKGLKVFATREPGGTGIGEQIRDVLHNLENTDMNPRTETLLYQAARAQFVEQIIKPHIYNGEIVLSDRYSDSTLAYQGYGHKQNIDVVRMLIKYATDGLVPDLSIFLNVDVNLGLERKKRQGEWNRMDALPADFYQRVRDGYLELMRLEPERWREVDANKSQDEVFADLTATIENELKRRGFLEGVKKASERL